eukprot:COSAG01_NODE_6143_length_3826_cov_3.718809_4_plen_106_part_00
MTREQFERTALAIIEQENAAKQRCLHMFAAFRALPVTMQYKLGYYMTEFHIPHAQVPAVFPPRACPPPPLLRPPSRGGIHSTLAAIVWGVTLRYYLVAVSKWLRW